MRTEKHTQRSRARVIKNFEESGRIDESCAMAGVDRSAHYRWMKKDPKYAAKFEEAKERAVDLLEAEAFRRARIGVLEPVFSHGKQAVAFVLGPDGKPEIDTTGKLKAVPAFIRKHSDQLLMFLLKGHRREVYGDKLEATGRDGKPLFDVASVRAYMQQAGDDEAE